MQFFSSSVAAFAGGQGPDDSCDYSGDGNCDEGQPMAEGDQVFCAPGTDCSDCGSHPSPSHAQRTEGGALEEGLVKCFGDPRKKHGAHHSGGCGPAEPECVDDDEALVALHIDVRDSVRGVATLCRYASCWAVP